MRVTFESTRICALMFHFSFNTWKVCQCDGEIWKWHNMNVTTFDGTVQLFLTMDVASDDPHRSRGTVRSELVSEMTRRTRSLIGNPSGRLFPLPRDSGTFRWTDAVSTSWMAHGPVPRRPSAEDHAAVIQMALRTMVTARTVGDDVQRWLQRNVPVVPDDYVEERANTLQRLQHGERPRRTPATYAQLRVLDDGEPAATSSAQLPPPVTITETQAEEVEELYDVPESLYEPPSGGSSGSYVSPAVTDRDWDTVSGDSSPYAAWSDDLRS